MTIVNDDSGVITKLETSLIDDARVVIYDCHMFTVQATDCLLNLIIQSHDYGSVLVKIFTKLTLNVIIKKRLVVRLEIVFLNHHQKGQYYKEFLCTKKQALRSKLGHSDWQGQTAWSIVMKLQVF